MKRKSTTKKFIWIVLCAALILAVALGFVFAKYTGSWEKDFGLTIKPVSSDMVLGENTSGTLFHTDTRHIVFGTASAYESHVTALMNTKKHVGSSEADEIYSYYDEATDTTYVLCEETICFNPNSSALFKDLTKLETVTLANYSTAKVTDMSRMFYGCGALTTVYDKGSFDTGSVTADADMFTGCQNLVGGEGTRVYPADSNTTTQPLDSTYARIDGANDLPGYFTGQAGWARCYFRSNSLKPVSENAVYTVDGADTWFTVANGLDSTMVSQGQVNYTLTYDISTDGVTWQAYDSKTGSLPANTYTVQKYAVAPVTADGTTYPWIKVTASTTSFQQEDICAVFCFVSTGYAVNRTYESGVIKLTVNTNSQSGSFTFAWAEGITPDNSDPSGTFATAAIGPGALTASLDKHTVYDYLFFVTDPTLLANLESDSTQITTLVTVEKN